MTTIPAKHDAHGILLCSCCGGRLLGKKGEYEIFPLCGWKDAPIQDAGLDYTGDANTLSLNQVKAKHLKK